MFSKYNFLIFQKNGNLLPFFCYLKPILMLIYFADDEVKFLTMKKLYVKIAIRIIFKYKIWHEVKLNEKDLV